MEATKVNSLTSKQRNKIDQTHFYCSRNDDVCQEKILAGPLTTCVQ